MKKQLHNKRLLLILLALLILSLTGYAVGKYVTTVGHSGYTVTFTARLAETFELRESKITQNDDGTYETLATTVESGTQSYTLIPGLDIPKDVHIVIGGKTEIPAYLYLKVVDNAPNGALRYEVLSANWTLVDSKTNASGVTTYQYQYVDVLDETFSGDPIYILKDNRFYVDQAILSGETSNLLTFSVYMEEVPQNNP